MDNNVQQVNIALKEIATSYKKLRIAFEPFITPETKLNIDIFFNQMNLVNGGNGEQLETEEDVQGYIMGIVASVSMQTKGGFDISELGSNKEEK